MVNPFSTVHAIYETSTPRQRIFLLFAATIVVTWWIASAKATQQTIVNVGGVDIFLHTHLYGPPPPDWISNPETWGMMADPSGHSVEECPVCNPDH